MENQSNGLGAMVQHKGIVLTKAEIAKLARQVGLTAEELEPPLPRVVKDLAGEVHIERVDGEVVAVMFIQDAKYGVLIEVFDAGRNRLRNEPAAGMPLPRRAHLANLTTGMPIPRDEPVFILRGQDKLALAAIETYCRSVTDNSTTVNERSGPTAHDAFMKFQRFAQEHPDRMKMPS